MHPYFSTKSQRIYHSLCYFLHQTFNDISIQLFGFFLSFLKSRFACICAIIGIFLVRLSISLCHIEYEVLRFVAFHFFFYLLHSLVVFVVVRLPSDAPCLQFQTTKSSKFQRMFLFLILQSLNFVGFFLCSIQSVSISLEFVSSSNGIWQKPCNSFDINENNCS